MVLAVVLGPPGGGARQAENWLSWSASGAAGGWLRPVSRCGGGRPRAAVVMLSHGGGCAGLARPRAVSLRGSSGRPVLGGAYPAVGAWWLHYMVDCARLQVR